MTKARTRPYFAHRQNEIGCPLGTAIPTATTLVLAPTAVASPPRSAPEGGAHHDALAAGEP